MTERGLDEARVNGTCSANGVGVLAVAAAEAGKAYEEDEEAEEEGEKEDEEGSEERDDLVLC